MKASYFRSMIIAGLGAGVLLAGCASEGASHSPGIPPMGAAMETKSAVSSRAMAADALNAPAAPQAARANMATAKTEGGAGSGRVAPAGENEQASVPEAMPRRIIYTAQTELTCADFGKAAEALSAAVKRHGGYVADSSVSGRTGETRSGTWKVRVPVEKFDAFLKDLGGVGDVENTQISSQDVSEEYYDLEARIKNKQVEEARLIQHLQQSTGKLNEILEVEREISRVREEVERMEGRRRLLANQSELTTIDITLRERTSLIPQAPPTLGSQIFQAFTDSAVGMGAFFKGILLTLIGLLPWAVVLGAIFMALWTAVKRGYAKRQGPGGRNAAESLAAGWAPRTGDRGDAGDR